MRTSIKLSNIEMNTILEDTVRQNLDDILEFCPENTNLRLTISRVLKNKNKFVVKILLKGPGLNIFSSSETDNILQGVVECKRKSLNQFKRFRSKSVFERRQQKARGIRDNRFKEVA